MKETPDDSERRLKSALEAADIGVWRWNTVTGEITGSPACETLFGVRSGEFPDTYPALLALVHPDDRPNLEDTLARARLTDGRWRQEYRVCFADGSVHCLHSSGQCFFDNSGNEIEMVVITRELEPSENEERERLRIALTHAIEGIAFLDTNGRYREVNRSYATALGYEIPEMIGLEWRESIHPDERERMAGVYRQMVREGKAEAETKGLRKDGTSFYKQTTIVRTDDRDGKTLGHYCFVKDISVAKDLEENRARAEAESRSVNTRLQFLLSNSPAVIFNCPIEDPAFGTTYVSENVENVLGYKASEFLSTPTFWKDRLHPDDRDRVIAGGDAAIARGDSLYTYEYRFLHGDGEYRWIHEKTHLVRDKDGKLREMVGCLIDISAEKRLETERDRVEAALRETGQRLRFLLSATGAVIFTCRPDGDYGTTYISENVRTLLGYKPERFLAEPGFWLSITHPDDRERIFQDNATIIETGYSIQEFRYRRANGQYIWVYEELRLVRDANGEPIEIVGYMIDVSDRVKIETRLKKSLEEKELLLREIHHRVKNNLHVVANLLDLQSDYIEDAKTLDLFADNQNRIQSMALIYEQMYRANESRSIEMGTYLDRLAGNLAYSYRESRPNLAIIVEAEPLRLDLETAVPCGLIVNEFVTNAYRHAFPPDRDGRIAIQLARGSGDLVRLSVTDNGRGFPVELDWQRSPTLGMRLVRILSQQLKAEITLDRRDGTTFTLTFRPLPYLSRF